MRITTRIYEAHVIGRIRPFSTCLKLSSGHNRWSKIKHDKGKADDAKNKQRSSLAKELTNASKSYGADPNSNTRLAALVANAKKAGFPKASIDAAIARGQGRSTSGAALENVTIEAMLPNAIAAVIECQTDSKARLLQDIREILKQHGATMTPTTYLFERKGRILFQPSLTASNEKLLEYAIEVGALDVDVEEDGTIVLLTEPKMISAIAEAMSSGLGLKTESTEFIWDPKQDAIVNVGSSEIASMLTRFTSQLRG